MKLFLGLILLIICIFIGYIKSNKYYFRRVFYDDFVKFNEKFKQEVSFKQRTIKNIIEDELSDSDFITVIKGSIFNEKTTEKNLNYLNENEIKYFKDYVSTIGTVDKTIQLDFLQNISNEIIDKQKQCVSEENKYKKLYIKLGFFIGLILLILVL